MLPTANQSDSKVVATSKDSAVLCLVVEEHASLAFRGKTMQWPWFVMQPGYVFHVNNVRMWHFCLRLKS